MILQVSSGSTGRPVHVVPRTLDDILSIHGIILRTWLTLFSAPPKRVALLGGISHGQAARHLKIGGTQFESFEPHELERLAEFNPQFLACYPSIARELVASPGLKLRDLRALKLGGERLFASDVAKIQARYPGLPVLEQLGSTEMPAVAMGIYRTPVDRRGLELQRQRFSFRLDALTDWQRLVVRDDFSAASAARGFLDTGDIVRIEADRIVDIQRGDDPAAPYFVAVERLLVRGCINVQIHRESRVLRYTGDVDLPHSVRLGTLRLTTEATPPLRLSHSNKLPLIV